MAHQGHNIPWGLLASNLEWKTPTPWNNFATNLYPRMKSNQAKDLTHFVNAFVRTLDEHSVCERKKYPKHYDIPEPSDVILDDTIVRKISPTVRRWRNNWPKAKTCPSGTCKKFEVVRETPMGMKRTELIGRCRCIPIPQEERVMPAFLRDPHVEIDWRYSGDDSNAEAIFNIKYVFTLLLYGEMEPILRVCAHPGNHLKFWFTGSYFEGDLGWIQICRHMLSVYNNIAGLYGGVAIREFLSLYRPEDCSYVAASSEVDEVRSILCSMGLPVELALETMKFANYKTPKGKLDPPHDPLHPANREALGQYLKYCWTEIGMDPVDRMEHADRDEGINWANLVGDAIIDLFGHHKDRREGRWHELNFDGQKLPRVWYKKEGVSDDETPFGWRGPYTIFV